MAILWEKTVRGKKYEVRSAGRTRRLYTDGVFHSQYNPARTLTGNVWDLISLPGFFLPEEQVRRVLVLGVGGGAVIQQLKKWYPHCQITGIELDRQHLHIAKHFFDLHDGSIDLIEDDAIRWVRCYRGLAFDIIIDDLFGEEAGEPSRAVQANEMWVKQLTRLLTGHGMLVMNFIGSRELRDSAFFHNRGIQKIFKQIFRFMTPLYENNIGVFLRKKSSVNEWRKRIISNEIVKKEFNEHRDKYQVRKLAG